MAKFRILNKIKIVRCEYIQFLQTSYHLNQPKVNTTRRHQVSGNFFYDIINLNSDPVSIRLFSGLAIRLPICLRI